MAMCITLLQSTLDSLERVTNWSYKWVLGARPRSSGRVTALYYQAVISQAPHFWFPQAEHQFVTQASLEYQVFCLVSTRTAGMPQARSLSTS